MHSCMRFFLRYNDHFVTIINMELFILYLLSKRLDEVEWQSNEQKPKFISTEFIDICMYLYANFLLMKQVI